MTSPGTVSAVVYSLNEAGLLVDCLPRLVGFDEIVVCDMGSNDDTAEVAASFGARVVQVPQVPVVEEVRQLGLDAASSDWVVFVDADELIPSGFRAAIQPVLDGPTDVVAVRLRYENEAFGRMLVHSLQGSAKFALLRRSGVRYGVPARAHEPPVLDGRGIEAPAEVPTITHLNFRTIEQTTEKILRYAANNPTRLAPIDGPLPLLREILRATVFSGAWRDGRAGFAVASLHVFGQMYGTLIAAERAGRLGADLPRSTVGPLAVLAGAQRSVVRARDGLVRALRGDR